MKLWIVGQHKEEIEEGKNVWEFGGVFDSEDKAIAACRSDDYYVAPFELNEAQPDETCKMIGSYYPFYDYEKEEWRKTKVKKAEVTA